MNRPSGRTRLWIIGYDIAADKRRRRVMTRLVSDDLRRTCG